MAIINPNNNTLSSGNILRAGNDKSTAMERIASGNRINSAQDDAASLAIAMRFLGQINGNTQATRNINDGISLAQTAENGLGQINESVQRMRELAVQSANGTLNDSDRANLQAEFATLQQSISDTLSNTSFNGQQLLTQDASIALQVGADSSDTFTINTANLAGNADISALLSANIGTQGGSSSALDTLSTALDTFSTQQAGFGAVQSRLASAYEQARGSADVEAEARGRLTDSDLASETAALARAGILENASLAMYAQANMSRESALALLNG